MKGSIRKWVDDRGFGFIKTPDGDLFLHVSKIIEGTPRYGADVEYKIDTGADKRTFAVAVKVLN
jgi:cold shock CspA family protein